MMHVRRAGERGQTRLGWLDSRHTFSFGEYYDPARMGFRSLRVLNDDRVVPGAGFGTHGHRDMEILSYVLDGALEHSDSLGNGSVIRPGEIQFMRAGTGVRHSEQNASKTEPVHFLQIWIVPRKVGLPPAYAQQVIDSDTASDGWVLLASPDARGRSIQVEQDVFMSLAIVPSQARRPMVLAPDRHVWLHVATGRVRIETTELEAGDGVAITGAREFTVTGAEGGGAPAHVLVFDLG